MPPPMPTSRFGAGGPSRMTANPAKPIGRYRPGKAVAEERSDSEEEEDEVEEVKPKQPEAPRPTASSFPVGRATSAPKAKPAPVQEESDEEGFVTEEEEEEDDEGSIAPPTAEKSKATPILSQESRPTSKVEEESEEDEESEEEESSEEDESSSEEEAPQRKLLRPTFIKKTDRSGKTESPGTGGDQHTSATPQPQATTTNGTPAPTADAFADEEARRRALADLMITDKLERDAIARAAGKKSWDDDEDVAPEDMVDDTDGLDPEAELAAWKLRELKRLKRDREAIEVREKELEEIERRRNLTAEEREKEDAEYLASQKEERESGKGKAGFMQRYHHKGAFFQDDETAKEILARRDLMGARYVDEVKNRDALPEYMQIRDMAKLGRKGRTRYKDLKSEDTGRWGEFGRPGQRKSFVGDDERFRPDDDRRGTQGPTGANAGALGSRRSENRKGAEGAPEGPRAFREDRRDRDRDGGDSYRPSRRRSPSESEEDDDDRRVRQRRKSYSRSRSRSQRRYRDEDLGGRRKRSPSPYRDRDKRRKVDAI